MTRRMPHMRCYRSGNASQGKQPGMRHHAGRESETDTKRTVKMRVRCKWRKTRRTADKRYRYPRSCQRGSLRYRRCPTCTACCYCKLCSRWHPPIDDGTVPDHLMSRLKRLEAQRQPTGRPANQESISASNLPAPPPVSNQGRGKNTPPSRPNVAPGSEEERLYVAFGQLLLEDDEESD